MTESNWRELCAELTGWIERAIRHYGGLGRVVSDPDVLIRARAALAQSEPEAVGPSDDDLALIYHDCCGGCEFMDQGGFEDAARAVLARFGAQR